MGKLSNRIKKLFQEQMSETLVNITDLRKGKELAEEYADSIHSVDELVDQGISPSLALYVNVQNLTSVLLEGIIELPPAKSMYTFFSKQENLYDPGFPPHSPITISYYNLWLQFDAAFGEDLETIGTCILDMADILKIEGIHKTALKNLCDSRLSIYEITKKDSDLYSLREYVTNKVFDVKFDVHFSGQAGDVVYTRIMPDLFGDGTFTAFGVPYQLLGYSENEWLNYLKRHGIESGTENFEQRFYKHMKYGKDRNYWVEFTFWGYLQHRPDVIYLMGLPDNVASQAAHESFNAFLKHESAYRKIEPRLLKSSTQRRSGPSLNAKNEKSIF